MLPDAIGWFFVVWLTVVGGAVGSFLNVVVYRLPAGISLIHPLSHCPICKHPIRWHDNIPVFGWIFLRGRCRDCSCPIPIRYPLIEALTAAMFGIPAVVLHLTQGTYLPCRTVEVAEGIFLGMSSPLQWYCIYAFQMMLLCTLLCAALIEYDRKRPPLRLFIPAFAIGVIAPLFWPMLRPVPACPHIPADLSGALDGLSGVAAGALLGGAAWLIARIAGRRSNVAERHPAGLFFCLLCVGLYLGWQAVTVLALATAALHVLTWPLRRWKSGLEVPPSLLLLLLTFVWITMWASLVQQWPAW